MTPWADTSHTQQKQDTRKVTCNASPSPEPRRPGGSAAVNNTTTILDGFSKNNISIQNDGLAMNLYSEMAAATEELKLNTWWKHMATLCMGLRRLCGRSMISEL